MVDGPTVGGAVLLSISKKGGVDLMDQSVDIPWSKGMNFGMGVNLLNGDIAGKAVDPGEITGPSKAEGQVVSYNLKEITSLEELYTSIGISVEASAHYG